MANMKEIFDSCPICGKKMEKGYLRNMEAWGWGWVKEEKPWTMGWCIEAYRCRGCKVIMLSSENVK